MRIKLPTRRPRRRGLGFGVAVGVVALAAAFVAFPFAADEAHADHIEVPSGDGEHFVWPTPSWVSATDDYVSGRHHSGSADLTAPYYTPIKPSRPGTVFNVDFNGTSGWYIQLKHEDVGDSTYYTFYGHLSDEPEVDVDDEVDLDTVLGHMSKTGNAHTQHLHFTIHRDDGDGRKPVKIPGIEIGDWVGGGEFIPGVYDENLDGDLPALDAIDHHSHEVRVDDPEGIWAFEEPGRGHDERMSHIEAGETFDVIDSHNGQYQVEVDGEVGWIPSSGVVPVDVDNDLFGLDVTAGMNVRKGPSEDDDLIGRVEAGSLLVALDSSNGWTYVIWRCDYETNRSDDDADDNEELGGCPDREPEGRVAMKYGWIGDAYTETTSDFSAITRIDDVSVHAEEIVDGESRPDYDTRLDALSLHSTMTVTATFDGWYQISYDDQTGWVRGWNTSTRR